MQKPFTSTLHSLFLNEKAKTLSFSIQTFYPSRFFPLTPLQKLASATSWRCICKDFPSFYGENEWFKKLLLIFNKTFLFYRDTWRQWIKSGADLPECNPGWLRGLEFLTMMWDLQSRPPSQEIVTVLDSSSSGGVWPRALAVGRRSPPLAFPQCPCLPGGESRARIWLQLQPTITQIVKVFLLDGHYPSVWKLERYT